MVGLITGIIESLFGQTLSKELGEWMSDLLDAVISVLESGNAIDNAITLFSGIAISLMTLYFFMEMYNNVSREMFTVDRLIVSLIKFFVAFAILLCLSDFITGMAKIGKYAYLAVDEGTIFSAQDATNDLLQNLQEIAKPGSDARKAFEDDLIKNDWDGVWGFVTHFGIVTTIGILSVLGLVARCVGYMVCVGNAIMILIYGVLSPLAVVNLFEEGSRSAGIRYLKKFGATCFTMAVILVGLQAVNALQVHIIALTLGQIVDASGNAITSLTAEHVGTVFGITNAAPLIVPQLASITILGGCSKISADVLGA